MKLGLHNVNEEALAEEQALFLEPRAAFDRAIIGMAQRCGDQLIVAYDEEACIQVLMDDSGMTWEEAAEFFDFNVAGAYMGPGTPIFISRAGELE